MLFNNQSRKGSTNGKSSIEQYLTHVGGEEEEVLSADNTSPSIQVTRILPDASAL